MYFKQLSFTQSRSAKFKLPPIDLSSVTLPVDFRQSQRSKTIRALMSHVLNSLSEQVAKEITVLREILTRNPGEEVLLKNKKELKKILNRVESCKKMASLLDLKESLLHALSFYGLALLTSIHSNGVTHEYKEIKTAAARFETLLLQLTKEEFEVLNEPVPRTRTPGSDAYFFRLHLTHSFLTAWEQVQSFRQVVSRTEAQDGGLESLLRELRHWNRKLVEIENAGDREDQLVDSFAKKISASFETSDREILTTTSELEAYARYLTIVLGTFPDPMLHAYREYLLDAIHSQICPKNPCYLRDEWVPAFHRIFLDLSHGISQQHANYTAKKKTERDSRHQAFQDSFRKACASQVATLDTLRAQWTLLKEQRQGATDLDSVDEILQHLESLRTQINALKFSLPKGAEKKTCEDQKSELSREVSAEASALKRLLKQASDIRLLFSVSSLERQSQEVEGLLRKFVTHPVLQGICTELYRPYAVVGDHGTAAILLKEVRLNVRYSDRGHSFKAELFVAKIEGTLFGACTDAFSLQEKLIMDCIRQDLLQALKNVPEKGPERLAWLATCPQLKPTES